MKFYVPKEDLERAERGCDLGDWVKVAVYLYPHRDSLPLLVQCETVKEKPETEEVAV